MGKAPIWFSILAGLLAASIGCKVQVDKAHDGGSGDVKVATPFGGVQVRSRISPAEVGITAYPGAVQENDNDGDKSAMVDLGFGSWKLKVRVVHYSTPDSRDQVLSFYRKALGQYGTVIECQGSTPVGEPVITSEGLRCDNDDAPSRQMKENGELQLKAGSPRHQHIVAIDRGDHANTRFSLIALDLPHGFKDERQQTN